MLGQILQFLLEITFTLFGVGLLIRAWMNSIRMPRFNPLALAIHRYTDWLVAPIARVVPHKRFDWPALLATWLTAFVFILLKWIVSVGSLPPLAFIVPALAAAVIMVVRWILNLIVWLTLIQAVLSWVNPQAPLMPLLHVLTAPILDPIRRVLPRTTIDFSPLAVLILAQIGIMVLSQLSVNLFGF